MKLMSFNEENGSPDWLNIIVALSAYLRGVFL
jgi:hypothetical protein